MSIKLQRKTKVQTNSELYKLRYEWWIGLNGNLRYAMTAYTHNFIVSKTTDIMNRFENRFRAEIYCFVHKIHKTLKNKQKHQIKISEVVIHLDVWVCTYERTNERMCLYAYRACIFDFDSLCAWATRIIKKYVAYIKGNNKYNNQFEFYVCTVSRVVQTNCEKKKKIKRGRGEMERGGSERAISRTYTSVIH